MAFGLGVLRLDPRAFWAMTMQELAAAVQGVNGDAGVASVLDQTGLAGLMDLFPDE